MAAARRPAGRRAGGTAGADVAAEDAGGAAAEPAGRGHGLLLRHGRLAARDRRLVGDPVHGQDAPHDPRDAGADVRLPVPHARLRAAAPDRRLPLVRDRAAGPASTPGDTKPRSGPSPDGRARSGRSCHARRTTRGVSSTAAAGLTIVATAARATAA